MPFLEMISCLNCHQPLSIRDDLREFTCPHCKAEHRLDGGVISLVHSLGQPQSTVVGTLISRMKDEPSKKANPRMVILLATVLMVMFMLGSLLLVMMLDR